MSSARRETGVVHSPASRFLRFTAAALAAMPLVCASPVAHAAAGDLDCSFGNGGKVDLNVGPGQAAYGVKLQSSGKIVTMGAGNTGIRVSRFLPGGTLDPTFGTAGTTWVAIPNLAAAQSLAVDSADRLLVTGWVTQSGVSSVLVARFTANGSLDTTFASPTGWTTFHFGPGTGTEGATVVAVDASDRPIVAGWRDPNGSTYNPSNSDMAVARLTTAGILDPTFGTGGIAYASSPGTATDDDVRAMGLDGDGNIVAAGITGNTVPRQTILARWTPAGVLDPAFGTGGVKIVDLTGTGGDSIPFDLVATGSGSGRRIHLLGNALLGLTNTPAVARLLADGSLDTAGWNAGGPVPGVVHRSFIGSQDVLARILLQADGKVLVTGWPIVPVGGFGFHFAVMRFTPAGALDTTWGAPNGVVTTNVAIIDRAYAALIQPDQRVLLAGGLDNDVRLGMARYLNDGQLLAPTTTLITAHAPDPSAAGVAVPVTVSVTATTGSAAPVGSVSVTDGSISCTATLGSPSGTTASGSCALTFGTPGARTLVASYLGDPAFCRSTSPSVSQGVTAAATTTSITADTPDPSVTGQAVVVTVSVSSANGPPPGSVQVSDGLGETCVATLASGTGSCSLAPSQAGDLTLTAAYAGDAAYQASQGTAPHRTDPAQTTVQLVSAVPTPAPVGTPVTVTFSVTVVTPGSGTPTGTVTVTSDRGSQCTAPASAGSCQLVSSVPGPHLLTASYSGDASFAASRTQGALPLELIGFALVPTLSGSGLAALAALLGSAGLLVQRRRRAPPGPRG